MLEPSRLQITVEGRGVRVGGNPAVTQALQSDGNGAAIAPGNTITLRGTVARDSVLYFRAAHTTPELYAVGDALFTGLGLESGGTAKVTIGIADGHLRYRLHRPDGTEAAPAATAGFDGPGVRAPVTHVPPSYVNSPATLAQTYIAAINARDGKTLCAIFTPELQRLYAENGKAPCWMLVSAYIDYTGENAERQFVRYGQFTVGDLRERHANSHLYVGVPLRLDTRFELAGSASVNAKPRLREKIDDVLWIEELDGSWRIAKPSLALMAAGLVGRAPDDDPLAAPAPASP